MFRRAVLLVVAAALAVSGFAAPSSAAPSTLPFAGRLTTPSGTPVPDGSYSVAFRLYTVASGGSSVWSETDSLSVAGGVFATYLGDGTPFTGINFASTTYYLAFQVGVDPEMTPRYEVGGVPAALSAAQLAGIDASLYARTDLTNVFSQPQTVSVGAAAGSGVSIQAASGFTGNLIDVAVNASSVFSVAQSGTVRLAGNLEVGSQVRITPTGILQNVTYQGTAVTSAYGGTGFSSYATGDMLYGSGSTLAKLSIGPDGRVLSVSAGEPRWVTVASLLGSQAVTSLNTLTGALTLANATTGGSTITINDASTSQKGIASFTAADFSVASGNVTIATGAITSAKIFDGTIATVDLGNEVVDTTKLADGAVTAIKLAANSVATGNVIDGTLSNADISASAGITLGKLANGASGQFILTNGLGVPTYQTISGDVLFSNAGVGTVQPNSVALDTDTTGFYVSGIVSGFGIDAEQFVTFGSDALSYSISLLDTPVSAGSYGSGTQVATFTVDQQGRLTAAGNTTITAGGIGAVPASRALTAGNGLTGGGDLSADRTFDIGAGTNILVNANDVAVVNNPTFSGQITGTATGTNALRLTGVPQAAATTALFQLGDAFSTNAQAYIGIEAPSGYTGDMFRFVNDDGIARLNGTNLSVMDSFGNLSTSIQPAKVTATTSLGYTEYNAISTVTQPALGTYTFDIQQPTLETTFSLENTAAGGSADLNLVDGGLQTAGTVRLTNSGVLQNVAANTSILTAGTLGVARGGTGLSSYTDGDLLYASSGGLVARSIGSAGQCLVVSSGFPVWGTCVQSSVTLQAVYANGNTIATTDARDLQFTLTNTTTDSNFVISRATGTTGSFAIRNAGTDRFVVGDNFVRVFMGTPATPQGQGIFLGASGSYNGAENAGIVVNPGAITGTGFRGFQSTINFTGSSAGTQSGAYRADLTVNTTSPHFGRAFEANLVTAGSALAEAVGVRVASTGSQVGVQYGLYADLAATGLTTEYGLYVQGASTGNYLQDRLGIGATPSTARLLVSDSSGADILQLAGSSVTGAFNANITDGLAISVSGATDRISLLEPTRVTAAGASSPVLAVRNTTGDAFSALSIRNAANTSTTVDILGSGRIISDITGSSTNLTLLQSAASGGTNMIYAQNAASGAEFLVSSYGLVWANGFSTGSGTFSTQIGGGDIVYGYGIDYGIQTGGSNFEIRTQDTDTNGAYDIGLMAHASSTEAANILIPGIRTGVNTARPNAVATEALLLLGNALSSGSASGTYIGLNAPTGFAGDFVNLQLSGTSNFKISSTGAITAPAISASSGVLNVNSLEVDTTVGGFINLDASGAGVDTLQLTAGTDIFLAIDTNVNGTINASGAIATSDTTRITNTGVLQNVTYNGTAVAAIYGGTGQSSYTTGDILYASSSTALSKLGVGTNGQCLTVSGGLPAWGSCGAGSGITSLNSQTGPAVTIQGTTNRISVSASSNTITLNAPQNIHTAADVQFQTINLQNGSFYDGSTTLSSTGLNVDPTSGNFTIDTRFTFAGGTSVLTLLNGEAGQVANFNLSDGALQTAGTIRLTNAGALQNITSITATGQIQTSATGQNALALTGAPQAAVNAALFQLGNTLSAGSGNGTFIGLNSGSFSGDFIRLQQLGNNRFTLTSSGTIDIRPTGTFANSTALLVRFADGSSSGDALRIQNSSGTTLFAIDGAGNIATGDSLPGVPLIGVDINSGSTPGDMITSSGPMYTSVGTGLQVSISAGAAYTANSGATRTWKCYLTAAALVNLPASSTRYITVTADGAVDAGGTACTLAASSTVPTFSATAPTMIVARVVTDATTVTSITDTRFFAGDAVLSYISKASGSQLDPGAVVKHDTANDNRITPTTATNDAQIYGVVAIGGASADTQVIVASAGTVHANAGTTTPRRYCAWAGPTGNVANANPAVALPATVNCVGSSLTTASSARPSVLIRLSPMANYQP